MNSNRQVYSFDEMNLCKYTNKLLKISSIGVGLTKIGFNFYCDLYGYNNKYGVN